jgi:hypothetical protein
MDLHILYIIFGIVSPQLPQAANPSKHTVYLHIEPKLNSILDIRKPLFSGYIYYIVARRPLLTALSSADPYIFYSYLITQPVGSCLHKKFINKVLSLVMATRIIYRAAR